jgi:hypothetical protein
MFGSFLPSLGWLAPPKLTRASEPTLSWNHLHSEPGCECNRDIAPTIVDVLTLAAGGAGVVIGIPRCPKQKEKHSSQWQATYYGNNACENRMPFDAAKHEIDHGAD